MKRFYYGGLFLFLLWVSYCIYGFATFQEMEFLLLLYVGVIGVIFFSFYFLVLLFWKRSRKLLYALIFSFLGVSLTIILFLLIN